MEYVNAKSILMSQSGGNGFGTDYVANLYRGCSSGCIYCDGHSDCYKMKNFHNVAVKRDALLILEDELSHKRKKGTVTLGAMGDSYNFHEKDLELTRGALHLFNKYKFGVFLETKSDLVLRDIDILQEIAKHAPVVVAFSVGTPYDDLRAKLEPKTSSVQRRFAALEKLSAAGLFTGICLMPVLPFVEDDSAGILSLVKKAADAGCKFAYASDGFGVTMRDSQRTYFFEKLEKIMPGVKQKYTEAYGDMFFCASPNNARLWQTFTDRCRALHLLYDMSDIVAAYNRPYGTQQISLFDF